jgi:cytochrome c oxidase subunit 2
MITSLITLSACQKEPVSSSAIPTAVEVVDEVEDEVTFNFDKVVPESATEVKSFTMTAKQWEFVPSTITVNEGDTVQLIITSIDVAHGFVLSEFGVDAVLEKDKTVRVEFVADKKGTFNFFCDVFCGEGHSTMKGSLVVK